MNINGRRGPIVMERADSKSLENETVLSFLQKAGVASAVCVIALGFLCLVGWAFDIRMLKTILPDSPPMPPNSAAAVIFLAETFLLMASPNRPLRIFSRFLALLVLSGAVLTVAEYVFGIDFGFNRPRAPSPESSFALCLAATATLLLLAGKRHLRLAESLFLITGGIGLLSLAGHLTGARAFHSIFSLAPAEGMAVHSAVALVLLMFSALSLNLRDGIASLLIANTAGGILARRMLLILLPSPVLIVFISVFTQKTGIFDPPVSHAFSFLLLLALLLITSWLIARRLDRTDRERLKAERDLRRSEQNYRSLINLAPDGIFTADLRGRYTDVNEAGCKLLGASRGEIVGKTIMDFIPPEDIPRLMADRAYMLKPGNVAIGEWLFKRKDRTLVPIEVAAAILPDGRWQGFVRDISKRKESEQALQKQTEALQVYANEIEDLYNHAPCGYHSLGPDGMILKINDTELNWLGYSREEVVGKKHVQDLLAEESRERFQILFSRFKESGFAHDLKFELVKKDGTRLPVLISGSAIRDASGRYVMSRSIVFDNTTQHKLEQDLQNALRARDEFLSVAAHDLRTPLTSLTLQIHLLQKACRESLSLEEAIGAHAVKGRVVSESMVQLIGQARGQIERLTNLVSDLMDLTRIRVGKLNLQLSPVDLVKVISETISSFSAELEAREIPVTIQGEKSLVGAWDLHRIDQIVVNLISNAIKYGMGRPIDIRIELTEAGKSVRLSVKDRGIGIPRDLQEKIFERFERATDDKKITGLGLGLYITKQLVEAHGGKIWVESVPEQGSTFILELPRKLESLPESNAA